MIVPMIGFGQSKKSGVVAATNMNILYAGIENPISVAISEVKLSDLTVEVDNGTVSKVSDGKFMIVPSMSSIARIINISVYVNDGGVKEKYLTSQFRVKRLPFPEIFPRFKDTVAVAAQLANQTFGAKIKDFDFSTSFAVRQFTVILISNKTEEITVNGYKNSEAAKLSIRKLTKGSMVLFKDFKVQLKDTDEIYSVPGSFKYTIK